MLNPPRARTSRIPTRSSARRGAQGLVLAALALVALPGCETLEALSMPYVPLPAEARPPPAEAPPIALSKVVANIPRGQPVLRYPKLMREEAFGKHKSCNDDRLTGTLDWDQGAVDLGSWQSELGQVFFDEMTTSGYDVAGDPSAIFGQQDALRSAEVLVGARITDLRANVCEKRSFKEREARKNRGEVYVCVEWVLYSNALQKEVARFDLPGYGASSKWQAGGVERLVNLAFGDATKRLAANRDLRDLLAGRAPMGQAVGIETPLVLESAPLRSGRLADELEQVLDGVVSIRVGTVHGSGFVVGPAGEILTNAHVVGDAKRASVAFDSGLEIDGVVERSNPEVDAALIRVPVRTRNALTIQRDLPEALDEVTAVGSPISETLSATVTRGVVSAVRRDGRTGLRHIQSDVAISPGSSGGPLVDGSGNVLGLAQQKIVGGGSSGLGFFIPIADALEALNITLAAPGEAIMTSATAAPVEPQPEPVQVAARSRSGCGSADEQGAEGQPASVAGSGDATDAEDVAEAEADALSARRVFESETQRAYYENCMGFFAKQGKPHSWRRVKCRELANARFGAAE